MFALASNVGYEFMMKQSAAKVPAVATKVQQYIIAKNHASNVAILFSNYHSSKYSRTLWLNIKYRHTLCIQVGILCIEYSHTLQSYDQLDTVKTYYNVGPRTPTVLGVTWTRSALTCTTSTRMTSTRTRSCRTSRAAFMTAATRPPPRQSRRKTTSSLPEVVVFSC